MKRSECSARGLLVSWSFLLGSCCQRNFLLRNARAPVDDERFCKDKTRHLIVHRLRRQVCLATLHCIRNVKQIPWVLDPTCWIVYLKFAPRSWILQQWVSSWHRSLPRKIRISIGSVTLQIDPSRVIVYGLSFTVGQDSLSVYVKFIFHEQNEIIFIEVKATKKSSTATRWSSVLCLTVILQSSSQTWWSIYFS